MKKSVILILLFVSFYPLGIRSQIIGGDTIVFNIGIGVEPDFPISPLPHAPMLMPRAILCDHTLYFNRTCGAEVFEVRQNDVVVYQTYLAGDMPVVILPDTVNGECELRLYSDSYTFTAWIEL